MATSKKSSLSAALHGAAGKKDPEPTPVATSDAPGPAQANVVPPSRQGKKIISGYFDPAVAKQLKQLALDQDATVQALLTEALNDLFQKHGKPSLA